MSKMPCSQLHIKLVMLARHYANELKIDSLDDVVKVINEGDASKGIPAMEGLGVTKNILIEAFEAYRQRPTTPKEKTTSAAAKLAREAKTDAAGRAELKRLTDLLSGQVTEPKTRSQKKKAARYKDDIQKAIDGLKAQLAEREKSSAPPSKLSKIMKSMVAKAEAGSDIRALVRALAKEVNSEAVDNGEKLEAEALRDRVHSIVIDVVSDGRWTLDDTQDVISGYGEFTPLSTDKKRIELTRIKQELQLLSKKRDLEEGKLPKKSGPERQKLSDRGREIDRDVRALLTQHNFNTDITQDPTKLASALQRIKSRLTNQKIDLERQIARGERSRRVFKAVPLDTDTQKLKDEVEALKKQLNEKVGKNDAPEIERLNKRIAEVEEKIRTGNLSVKTRQTQDSEIVAKLKGTLDALNKRLAAMRSDSKQRVRLQELIAKLRKQIDTKQIEIKAKAEKKEQREKPADIVEMAKEAAYLSRVRNLIASTQNIQRQLKDGPDEKAPKRAEEDPMILRLTADRNLHRARLNRLIESMKPKTPLQKLFNAIGSYRSLRASGDFPPLGRQGFVNLLTHPLLSASAFVKSMIAMVNPSRAAELDIDMREQPDFDEMVKYGLYFSPIEGGSMTEREEEMMGDLAERIPILGRFIIRPSARGYVTLLNQMSYHIMRKTMQWIPRDAPNRDIAMRALASKLNDFRGRGSFSNLKTDQSDPISIKAENIASNLGQLLFFSIRNWIAKFKLVSLYHLWSPLVGRGTWRTSAMAAADYAKFIFGVKLGIFLLKAAGLVEPDDDDDDLRSYMLGKVKVGDSIVDLSGQVGSELGFWARILTASDAKGKKLDRADILLNRGRGKLSPSAAAFVEVILKQQDYNGKPLWDNKSPINTMGLIAEHLVGEPPDPVRKILTGQFSNAFDDMGLEDIARIYPTSMSGQDVARALENEDKPASFALSLASLLGFGLQDETERKEAKAQMKRYKAEGRY